MVKPRIIPAMTLQVIISGGRMVNKGVIKLIAKEKKVGRVVTITVGVAASTSDDSTSAFSRLTKKTKDISSKLEELLLFNSAGVFKWSILLPPKNVNLALIMFHP